MGHKSKTSLPQQVFERLESMERYGHSKRQDRADGIADRYIYSFETMKSYKAHACAFVQWAKTAPQVREILGRSPRTLDEIRPFAAAWLKEREAQGLSAYTLKLERSALSKLYQEPIEVELRGARRADIKRSRGTAKRDAHFSEERNAALITFCRCAGPRRAELEVLKPSALEWHGGAPYIRYTEGTKGGRERLSPLCGSPEEVAAAVEYVQGLTGRNRVHSAADIHGYRSDYATRVYRAYMGDLEALRGKVIDYTALTGKRHRDGSTIVKSALYYCRGNRAGEVFDRAAMIAASRALGHNRESVVGEHYIRL